MIGDGKPIDTSRFFVVCINSLGSPFGSSGPASIDPRTGRPYGINFPEIAVEDIATRRARGVAYARHRARRVRGRPVARRHGRARLWRAVPRRGRQPHDDLGRRERVAVRDRAALAAAGDGPQRSGMARRQLRAGAWPAARAAACAQAGHHHLSLGRGMAAALRPPPACRKPRDSPAISARSSRSRHTSSTRRSASRISSTRTRTSTFRARWTSSTSRSTADGSLAAAFAKFRTRRTLVIGVEHDMLYHDRPAARDRRRNCEAAGRHVEFHAFPSVQGHDSFLVDLARFEPAIGNFLKSI